MTPPPNEALVPLSWNLFLSSTVRDLESYRQAVRDACQHRAETSCFLSEEDWPGGYDDTVAKCEEKIRLANAFMLLMGYWYGSVPTGRDRSITHLEFETARQRWLDEQFPPMAVLMPEEGSDADRELKGLAEDIVRQKGLDPAAHEDAISGFRTAVTGSWRTVTKFKDKSDLREHVIVCCLLWKGRTLVAAARERAVAGPGGPQVSDEQLGSIGREPQLGAVRSILARLAAHPDVPAVAMIVSGDGDAGQLQFLRRLVHDELRRYYPRRGPASLPVACDPGELAPWFAEALGLPAGSISTPEQLAERVADGLKRQPLFLSLNHLGDLPGGPAAFRDTFWAPFYRELKALRASRGFTHRLVFVGAEYSGDYPEAATCEPDARGDAADYTRLLAIPRLGRVDRDDLFSWFDEVNVPDEPAGRRSALVDRVLHESDGVPLRVFDRLRGETLWPDGGDA
jgi:hypothetical protein